MKLIIPMAGMGKRLRPLTLVTPKPLLKIGKKTIVEWIIQEIIDSTERVIDEIHYVIGDFGEEVKKDLLEISSNFNAKGFIHYQHEALGTGHAIFCADEALSGEVIVTFADTLFEGKISIDKNCDGIIWTKFVENPEMYGVVRKDENNVISGFVEKPKSFVSNNAIVGIYYFKEASKLKEEIEYIIQNDLRENNEYQITNCLQALIEKGDKFLCDEIDTWLDCGNFTEIKRTAFYLLEKGRIGSKKPISTDSTYNSNTIFGDNTSILNSKIGSNVILGDNCIVENCILENCIVYSNSYLKNSNLHSSIIGIESKIDGLEGKIIGGDYLVYEKN